MILCAAWEAGAAHWLLPLVRSLGTGVQFYVAAAGRRLLDRHGGQGIGLPISALADADRHPVRLCILSATGHPGETALVRECAGRGVPTLQFVDHWVAIDRRFPGGIWPTCIAVVDRAAAAAGAAAGLPADRLMVLGHPGWEAAPRLGEPLAGHAVFVGQPVEAHHGNNLGYTERSAWQQFLDTAGNDWTVCYLRHPAENRMPDGASARYETTDTGGMLRQAAVIVGMFSSLMVDAFVGGRAVISFQPGLSAVNPCGLSRAGYVPLAKTRADLKRLLQDLHRPSSRFPVENPFAGSLARTHAVIADLAGAPI